MKKYSASVILAGLVSIVVLAHFVFAADRPRVAADAERREVGSLLPGTKYVITAQLECEVHEVDENAVLVTVTAIREADQGVPMLSKVPYISRQFKNLGVARTETRVIISIPKDRIETIRSVEAEGRGNQ